MSIHDHQVNPDSETLASSLYTFVEDPNVKKFELTDEEYAGRRGEHLTATFW